MVVIAFALICLGLVGLLFYERRKADEREEAWRLERTGLLQRIQAPELAVRKHHQDDAPKERAKVLALNDDAAFKEHYDESMNGIAD